MIRPSELAKLLGKPQQAVYQYAKRGLPLLKTEEGTRIDLEEAKAFFARLGITLPSELPETPQLSAPKPIQRARVSTAEEGQFLVWPKIVKPGVTVGKVVARNSQAGVVTVKCNDGTDAPFAVHDLKKLVREGRVSLVGIDVILELVLSELEYLEQPTVAELVRRALEAYKEVESEGAN